jgi:hypothetical protein
MLQAIYTKERTRQASSLYCQWIGVERPQGTQLVAVWIDTEMRAFTGGQGHGAQLELQPDEVEGESLLRADGPGGR